MNNLFRMLVLVGLLFAETSRAAETATPELRGMLATGADRRFALAIPGSDQTAWVAVGGNFAGWKLSAYRPADDVLVLSKDGREFLLKLSSSKIGVADEKATLADAEAVIGKMKFEALIGKMLDQQKQSWLAMTKKMAGNAKGVNQADYDAFQSKVMDAMNAAMKPEDMKADFAKVYSEVFTKSELQGLADFYDSPTGQAMIDKQPEVQQKTMAAIMPRMMAAMPKVQQLSEEFNKEQAAKKAAAKAAAAAPAPAATP
jgi:hypothetical protein